MISPQQEICTHVCHFDKMKKRIWGYKKSDGRSPFYKSDSSSTHYNTDDDDGDIELVFINEDNNSTRATHIEEGERLWQI